jgi:hypothetical protein
MTTYEEVVSMIERLSDEDQVRVIEHTSGLLRHKLMRLEGHSTPSLYGSFADVIPPLSAEDIDEARREMWANFPREDI